MQESQITSLTAQQQVAPAIGHSHHGEPACDACSASVAAPGSCPSALALSARRGASSACSLQAAAVL